LLFFKYSVKSVSSFTAAPPLELAPVDGPHPGLAVDVPPPGLAAPPLGLVAAVDVPPLGRVAAVDALPLAGLVVAALRSQIK
jgi:hypothetical protein